MASCDYFSQVIIYELKSHAVLHLMFLLRSISQNRISRPNSTNHVTVAAEHTECLQLVLFQTENDELVFK